MSINTSLVLEKAKKAINEYKMLENVSTVVVGLSGGADSVCLLHVLNLLKNDCNLNLIAAHVNHGIRGEEAENDAIFSMNFAESLNVHFSLLKANCVEEAEESGETLEEAGRRIRYEFFDMLCEDETYVIATAHNSNDNMETVIFNITRGSALSGAKGIPPKRDNIIRPLIFCSREEIEGYCKENNLEYVTDSTNLTDDYTRNRIRHNVLPELKKVNSNVIESFTRFSQSVRVDDEFLDSVAETALESSQIDECSYSVDAITSLHQSIKNRVIFKAIKNFSNETPDSKKINLVLNCINENSKIQLYKNCYCETKENELKFFKNDNNNECEKQEIKLTKNENFNISFGEITVNGEYFLVTSQKINNLLLDNLIDCDTINGNLVLRSRKEGDKIKLPKRNVTKTLKKLFIEDNIPQEKRDLIPVLVDDNGVIWVAGYGVNKGNALKKSTKNILSVSVSEKNGFTKNE
jgi:tRNA(Ile)-lysidine synthase